MSVVINEDESLSAVWLIATLNGREDDNVRNKIRSFNNYRNFKNKKSMNSIDIVRTCNSIINVSNRISLRNTSNLMFGTVLAFKGKCLQNWKDVNNCRSLIQRINYFINKSIDNNININTNKQLNLLIKENGKNNKIQLLKDDTKFDISQGLIDDYESKFNKEEFDNNDWKNDHGFIMEIEEEEEEEVEMEGDKEFNTQSEKWDDLEFAFDTNGDIIGNIRNENFDETKIRESFIEENKNINELNIDFENNLDQRFDILPEFDVDINNDHLNNEEATENNDRMDENEQTNPSITTKKKGKRKDKRVQKKLIIDNDVCLSISCIKEIRDGYVLHEDRERMKFMCGMNKSIQNIMIREFSNIYNEYRLNFTNLVGEKNFNLPVQDDKIPEFDVVDLNNYNNNANMDIEIGRERQHSRSSSIASIEEARRSNTRHSSSFHFDFNNNENNENYNTTDMDLAQLDISITDINKNNKVMSRNLEKEIEKEIENQIISDDEINLISVEEFYNEIASYNEKDISFNEIVQYLECDKHEAASKFMYVLQLATWNRIKVQQLNGFRGEISIRLV